MYEKLVKSLRTCSYGTSEDCKLCSFYDEEDFATCDDKLKVTAADVIEQLSTYSDFYEELTDKGIKTIRELLDKFPKWIPVTERLPEKCGRYIVLLKASEDETKRWIEWGLGDDADIILEMLYDADQKIWKTDCGAYNAILSVVNREHDSCVTHWMPLPKLPKGEQE